MCTAVAAAVAAARGCSEHGFASCCYAPEAKKGYDIGLMVTLEPSQTSELTGITCTQSRVS
jgi:hypothetical protein